jgi:hypothetical protein
MPVDKRRFDSGTRGLASFPLAEVSPPDHKPRVTPSLPGGNERFQRGAEVAIYC